MKKATVQISYPAEKLNAIQHYMEEKGVDLKAEMEDALQKSYEKYVPKEVRAYLEIQSKKEPVKPSRSPQPKQPDTATEPGNRVGGEYR